MNIITDLFSQIDVDSPDLDVIRDLLETVEKDLYFLTSELESRAKADADVCIAEWVYDEVLEIKERYGK